MDVDLKKIVVMTAHNNGNAIGTKTQFWFLGLEVTPQSIRIANAHQPLGFGPLIADVQAVEKAQNVFLENILLIQKIQKWCMVDALICDEREQECVEQVEQEEMEIGLEALTSKYGVQKIKDALSRMAEK